MADALTVAANLTTTVDSGLLPHHLLIVLFKPCFYEYLPESLQVMRRLLSLIHI